MPPQRVVATIAGAVFVLGSAGACGNGLSDGASPDKATKLPSDLCATVPGEFVSAYALDATDHQHTTDEDQATATCTMSGTAGGQPVAVTLEVTSYAGSGTETPTERATAATTDRCQDLRSSARLPDVTIQKNRCAATSGPDQDTPGGHVVDISRLPSEGAMLTIDLDAPGQQTSRVQFDVTGLATSYLSDGLLG